LEIIMNRYLLVVIGTTALLLAGCGTSTQDRALSGGGIGAGAGALGGMLLGHPLEGALIGGAAGAAGGALTSSSDVDLGTPIWKR
jgi:osmotically inducible lipoprotein OsmB